MHTQRLQFDRNKFIGFGTLFPVAIVLIAATTNLPATAQSVRGEAIRFDDVNQPSDRNPAFNNNPTGYIKPGFYPSADYYSYPNPVIRRTSVQRQVVVDPSNVTVYQASDRNPVFYNNSYPGYPFGYVNSGFYPALNHYPDPSPIYRSDLPLSNPVLVNPTIRNSTLINPIIINPK